MQSAFLFIFDTQSPSKRLEIYQVVEFVLCKSAFLLIFDTQKPIKILGNYQVAKFALCKSTFFLLILYIQSSHIK